MLGRHQEAFDAELEAIVRGIRLAAERRETGARYTVFTESQAAMKRMLEDSPRPGQSKATFGIRLPQIIESRGSSVEIDWVPGHSGVEGDEHADLYAKAAAEIDAWNKKEKEKGAISLATLKARRTNKATKEWIKDIED